MTRELLNATPEEGSASAERLRILLVDDEPNIREALREYLSSINNHHVVCAAGGPEALAIFKPGAFDCAFLDLKMPDMTGVELLTRLKAQDKSLPVIIMTGFPSLDAAIDTMRQGASDFLIKPFNLSEIKVTLERVVREQRLLKENLRLADRLRHQERIEKLNRELQRRIREQHIIHQISESIDRMHTSEDIYQGMSALAARYLDSEKTAVLLLDRSTNQLLVIAVHGFEEEAIGQSAATLGQGVLGKVAAEGQPMFGQGENETRLSNFLPVKGPFFVVPINIREEIFGVLLVGEKSGGLPYNGEDMFVARFLCQKAVLSIENIALYESMVANMHSTLGALVSAMEAKDPYTRQHSRRVTNFSVLTAQAMNLSIDQVESLRFAAYLHDIGKIGVKDHILLKDSRLSDQEYEQIKLHPVIGEAIIQAMDLTQNERSIIRHHHERWDGRGYPDQLSGEGIPLLARIVAVADAYDAMTSDRPYRKAKNRDDAVREITRCSGEQFDPKVVEAFLEMLVRYAPSEGGDMSIGETIACMEGPQG